MAAHEFDFAGLDEDSAGVTVTAQRAQLDRYAQELASKAGAPATAGEHARTKRATLRYVLGILGWELTVRDGRWAVEEAEL